MMNVILKTVKKFPVWIALAILAAILASVTPSNYPDREAIKSAELFLRGNEQIHQEIGLIKEIGVIKRRTVMSSIPINPNIPPSEGYKEFTFYIKGLEKNFFVIVRGKTAIGNEVPTKYSIVSIEFE